MGNPIVHVEIIGPDPDELRRFYADLFGWDAAAGAPVAERVSAPDQYSFIDPPDDAPAPPSGIGGGMSYAAQAVFYVGVADVTEALEHAERLGGTVVLPAQRNEGGGVTVGHFTDPAGNLVGVASPD